MNQARFVSNGYGEERVQFESRLHWIRINTYAPQTNPFQVFQTELVLQDQLFNFADYTREKDYSVFALKPLPTQSYEKHDGVQTEISFRRNLDLRIVTRSGYTLLDLIANVGGLRTILAFVIGQFINYWCFNSPQNYMVSRLFTYKRRGYDERDKPEWMRYYPRKLEGGTNGLCEYVRSLLPNSCRCRDDN